MDDNKCVDKQKDLRERLIMQVFCIPFTERRDDLIELMRAFLPCMTAEVPPIFGDQGREIQKLSQEYSWNRVHPKESPSIVFGQNWIQLEG